MSPRSTCCKPLAFTGKEFSARSWLFRLAAPMPLVTVIKGVALQWPRQSVAPITWKAGAAVQRTRLAESLVRHRLSDRGSLVACLGAISPAVDEQTCS